MEMQTIGTLTGVQRSVGDSVIEGKQVKWDYTKFHLISELPTKGNNSRGQATQEYRFGSSSEFEKWMNIPLPATVEVTFTLSTNGKSGQSTELTAIKPQGTQPTRVK